MGLCAQAQQQKCAECLLSLQFLPSYKCQGAGPVGGQMTVMDGSSWRSEGTFTQRKKVDFKGKEPSEEPGL